VIDEFRAELEGKIGKAKAKVKLRELVRIVNARSKSQPAGRNRS